jgi:purine nucleoside phosphorylase
MPRNNKRYALIAGTGFGAFAKDATLHRLSTQFGEPSSPIRELEYSDQIVYLLARHGDEVTIPAHLVNYRANLTALSELGVARIIALNTVGVIAARQYPGQLAVPEQLIDYTYGRDHSIYTAKSANLTHIDFTEPFCTELRTGLLKAAERADVECHDGGVYAVTQGPRLETAAEVDRLERDGADYVGMTALPEASLARELGMQYACLSLLVNFAAGRSDGGIHRDIETNIMTAKTQAMIVLRAYFGADAS